MLASDIQYDRRGDRENRHHEVACGAEPAVIGVRRTVLHKLVLWKRPAERTERALGEPSLYLRSAVRCGMQSSCAQSLWETAVGRDCSPHCAVTVCQNYDWPALHRTPAIVSCGSFRLSAH